MSYDLTLFRPPPGLDPLDVCHRIERGEEGYEFGPSDPRQLADLVKARVPDFHEAVLRNGSIELDHDAQIQMFFTSREIGITMPYFRAGLEPMLEVIAQCIGSLADAGFVAFDPQLDRIVTADDIPRIAAQYRGTDHVLPHIVEQSRRNRPGTARPWWKFW